MPDGLWIVPPLPASVDSSSICPPPPWTTLRSPQGLGQRCELPTRPVLAVRGDAGGASDPLVAYGVGAILLCSAVLWPDPALGPVARHLAPLTFGIYLVHPLVILVLSRVPHLRRIV
jgi:hypothetical protein